MHLIFVPHTHWDREWYRPLEVFRMRLAELVLGLLDLLESNPLYACFVMDGQVAVLEDFLAWHPEQRERITRLAGVQRLRIGPWYTLPDEFLVSGESLIRNLMTGRRLARELGDWMALGYCPDPFGHVGQLPQILRGFGIDHAIFTRGMGDEPRSTEYFWRSPDGSEVLATCLLHAYSNAGRLPEDFEEATKRLQAELDWIGDDHATPFILLCQGGDHHTPQPFLPDFVKHLREKRRYRSVTIGHFEHYSKLVRQQDLSHLPRIEGTLRGSKHYPLLSGVLSARVDVKLRAEQSEVLLTRWVEPLTALAGLFSPLDVRVPLRMAWRWLLQNHAHDTICACSPDAVVRESLVRFDKVDQIGSDLRDRAVERLVEALEVPAPENPEALTYVVMNPLGFPRTEPVRLTVTEPAEEPEGTYVVKDGNGRTIASQVLSVTTREARHPEPSRQPRRDTMIVFVAENVPAVGTAPFHVEKVEPAEKTESPAPGGGPSVANEFLRATLDEDGTFTVEDVRTGAVFRGLGALEDEGDEGDTYNLSRVPGDGPARVRLAEIGRIAAVDGPVQKTLVMEATAVFPAGLSADRRARDEATVRCPVGLTVTVYRGVPRVDVVLTLENRARDHRLRMAFPLTERNVTVRTDEALDLTVVPEIPSGEGWIERPSGDWPMGCLADLTGDGQAIAVLATGVRELQVRREREESTALLTLLRAVGWMSRQDNSFRGPEAGPKMETPDAQMQGVHTFRLALWPHAPGAHAAALRQAAAHQAPLEAFAARPHAGRVPAGGSLVSCEPPDLMLSALKESERGDGVVLRFFNPTDCVHVLRVTTVLPVRAMRLLNLAEEPQGDELPLGTAVAVAPHEIRTVALLP